jgi:heme/copper-type cytochrome/quinol oxidase subunit 1
MHSLVRRYIKTAIAFLAAGLGIGLWMLVRRELYGRFASPFETSAHTHALLVGFMMEMICGVALWLFPRPEKGDARYRPALAESAYWLLTIGTAVRVAAELARPAAALLALRWTIVLCGAAQTAGLLLFFYTMWSRIRPLGSAARERAGERF